MRYLGPALALALLVGGLVPGVGPSPARADCGRQWPSPDIRRHVGFALEGVVRSVEGRDVPTVGWLYRVTVDVTEMLAGDPVHQLVLDLGSGDCVELQGDRYKAGDRLIVTASGPPTDGQVAYLPDALTWRYEWADRWTFHGLPDALAATFPPRIRKATTRDEILELVAPDQLPYTVTPDAWRVTLARPGTRERLSDLVAFGDGFVALGHRTTVRRARSGARTVPTVWVSATGRGWKHAGSPFGGLRGEHASVSRLVVFADHVYAVGSDGRHLRVWRSREGRRWVRVDLGPASEAHAAESAGRAVTVLGVAANGDRVLVLTGHLGSDDRADAAWTSEDGTTWGHATPSGLLGLIQDLTPGSDGFLASSCLCSRPQPDSVLWASADGTAWAEVGGLPRLSSGIALDEVRGRILGATLELHPDRRMFGALDASVDGRDWSRVIAAPGTATSQVEVAASDGTLVLWVSRYGPEDQRTVVMWSSDDGITWALDRLPGAREAECVSKVVVGATAMVAVGRCGARLAWTAER